MTIQVVTREKRMLRPAMAMMTTPIADPKAGLRTRRGAESEGVL